MFKFIVDNLLNYSKILNSKKEYIYIEVSINCGTDFIKYILTNDFKKYKNKAGLLYNRETFIIKYDGVQNA